VNVLWSDRFEAGARVVAEFVAPVAIPASHPGPGVYFVTFSSPY
jgi:hypothetical protein